MRDWRIWIFLAMTLAFLGCRNSTTVESIGDGDSEVGSASVGEDDSEATSTSVVSPADAELNSAQAYIERMQSLVQGRATLDDVESAIQLGKQGLQKFPEDSLAQALTSLMHQSLPLFAKDVSKLNARRLELGHMGRQLALKPEVLEKIGDWAGFLFLEEAKAHLSVGDATQGWASIQEARRFGFDQPRLLFFESEFESIVQDEVHASDVTSWLNEKLDKELASYEAYKFEFELKSLDDEATVSQADLAEKEWLLVDLWGTWCPPCRAEIPHLIELQEEMGGQLGVIGINFEDPRGQASYENSKTSVAQFRKSQPVPYPCLHGNFDPDEKVRGFKGYPTMLLLDKNGMVRFSMTGYQPLPVLKATIARVIDAGNSATN